MGRSKSIPQQRRKCSNIIAPCDHHDDGGCCDRSLSLGRLFAINQQQEQQQGGGGEEDALSWRLAAELAVTLQNGDCDEEEQEEEEHQQQQYSRFRACTTHPGVLARVQAQQAQQQQEQHAVTATRLRRDNIRSAPRSQRPRKRPRNQRGRVHFLGNDHHHHDHNHHHNNDNCNNNRITNNSGLVVVTVIPPPELTIRFLSSDASSCCLDGEDVTTTPTPSTTTTTTTRRTTTKRMLQYQYHSSRHGPFNQPTVPLPSHHHHPPPPPRVSTAKLATSFGTLGTFVLPHTQLVVIGGDKDDDDDDHYNNNSNNDNKDKDDLTEKTTRSESSSSLPLSSPLALTTTLAVRDLWKHYAHFLPGTSTTIAGNKDSSPRLFVDALCHCLQHEWIQIHLHCHPQQQQQNHDQPPLPPPASSSSSLLLFSETTVVSLSISLTHRAIEGTSHATIQKPITRQSLAARMVGFPPKRPPLSSLSSSSSPSSLARDLAVILAALVIPSSSPTNTTAPSMSFTRPTHTNTVPKTRTMMMMDASAEEINGDDDHDENPAAIPTTMTTRIITAKQVYDLTDNQQLCRALLLSPPQQQQQQQPRESIPGLVPTLRPYQQAAVEWMLQREQATTKGEEWKLAWVVLVPASNDCNHQSNNYSSTSSTITTMLSLPQWTDRKRQQETLDAAAGLLLYCPFTGWLATSLAHAQQLTMKDSDREGWPLEEESVVPVQGGILAESMGLGKTVEVLACILAHRRPPLPSSLSSSSMRMQSCSETVQRLDFGRVASQPPAIGSSSDRETAKANANEETSVTGKAPVVGVVDDMAEFGDAESSSDEGEEEEAAAAAVAAAIIAETNGAAQTVPPVVSDEIRLSAAVAISTDRPAVPVTPEKERPDVPERWVDDDVVGSCICGRLIAFSTTRKKEQGTILIRLLAAVHWRQ